MPLTIFLSWQADTPTGIGRNFLERALRDALAKIAADVELDEAIRDEGLAIDRDTLGVPGSPPIVDTILRKIDGAAVFVPDLTFVGTRSGNRGMPNPNVLIEYGWALKQLTHSRIVPVMNTAFGEPSAESMPFNLRHHRNPIAYRLTDEATDDERRKQREALAKQLENAIRTIISSGALSPLVKKTDPFIPVQPTADPAVFLPERETFVTLQDGVLRSESHPIQLRRGPSMYFRLLPTRIGNQWTPLKLEQLATRNGMNLYPLGPAMGLDWGINRYGFAVVGGGARQNGVASCVVQVFKTGEIWTIDAASLHDDEDHRLAIPPFERNYIEAATNYRRFLHDFLDIRPPYRWIAGMTGLEGREIVLPPAPAGFFNFRPTAGSCVTDRIEMDGLVSLEDDISAALKPFFDEVWEHCGIQRRPS